MAFAVERVSPAPGDERLAGFEVERPRSGARGDLHVLGIAGWVAGRDREARAVEVLYHGSAVQVAPVRGARPDVAGARRGVSPGQDVSWEALVGLVGLRRDAELELRAVLEGGERVPAAVIELRRTPLRSTFEPRLQPLMLTSLGRSGSTWLMKMFASHPEIVTLRRFPYEASTAKYWMHALKVLSDPANLELSAHPDSFDSNRWWVGSNPFYDAPAVDDPVRAEWLAGEHVERLARFFQESAEQWYLSVARSQHQAAPRYFAEKHLWPTFVPLLMRELYPDAREVFLVRDFRDVACSALAMDERRPDAGIGRTPEMSEEHYVRDVVRRMATDLRRSFQTRREGAHLVRYEDMAREPRPTLTSLLSFLGVDASGPTVDRVLELAAQDVPDLPGSTFDPELVGGHRGQRSPEESIGRWRARDESFRAVLDDALGDALDAFGYERERAGAGGRAAVGAPPPAVD